MIRRSWYLVAAVACFATAPLAAQQAGPQAPLAARTTSPAAGPRLDPGFRSYQPTVRQKNAAPAPAMAAAADRTVITISTLGLVLLGILLIILLT
jgi:hypothetical protein